MIDQYLFDSDDFEENVSLFAESIASILRMRQRHGHLVRPVIEALEAVTEEGGCLELAPFVAPISPRKPASGQRRPCFMRTCNTLGRSSPFPKTACAYVWQRGDNRIMEERLHVF